MEVMREERERETPNKEIVKTDTRKEERENQREGKSEYG